MQTLHRPPASLPHRLYGALAPLVVPAALLIGLILVIATGWFAYGWSHAYDSLIQQSAAHAKVDRWSMLAGVAVGFSVAAFVLSWLGAGYGPLWWCGLILMLVSGWMDAKGDYLPLAGLWLWAAMAVAFAWRTWRTKAIHSTLWLLGVIGVLALVAFKYPGTRFAHLSAADLHHGLLAVLAALTLPAGVVLTYRGLWRAGTHLPQPGQGGSSATAPAPTPLAPSPDEADRAAEAKRRNHAELAERRRQIDAFRKPPAINFADVDGYEREKLKLRQAIEPVLRKAADAGVGALLYGPPGNGKSLLAVATAGELGVPILRINYADTNSTWVGRTSQKIFEELDEAFKFPAGAVVIFDECDALWTDRSRAIAGSGNDEYQRLIGGFLERFDRLREQGIAVIATTNRPDTLDPALIREGRINLKLEVGNPDADGRDAVIAKVAAAHQLQIEPALRRWFVGFSAGFSVARLRAIVVRAGAACPELSADALLAALRDTSGEARVNAESVVPLDQLILPPDVQRFADEVLPALADPFVFEHENGGVPPQGAVFCGSPGTGKTALARALALAADCNLVVAGGASLAASPALVQETIAKAIRLKPSILFIDEAEPLLQRRDGVLPNSGAITQFLELTGSSASGLSGVLLLAATNLPDTLDPAVLRGGRFGRSIWFALPTAEVIAKALRDLLAAAPIPHELDVNELARTLAAHQKSLADLNSIVQVARSRAAARAMRTQAPSVMIGDDFS